MGGLISLKVLTKAKHRQSYIKFGFNGGQRMKKGSDYTVKVDIRNTKDKRQKARETERQRRK